MPLPYEQALNRIRAEYMEMPGMQLTGPQVERLCGVDAVVCRAVLADLVRARFLSVGDDGSYGRSNTTPSPPPAPAATQRRRVDDHPAENPGGTPTGPYSRADG